MKPFLNIITAVSRPENLHLLKQNIIDELKEYFYVTWYCIYDIGKNNPFIELNEDWIISLSGGFPNDCSGGSQRNIALKLITKGWIYCLDDDNLLYKDFGKILSEKINQYANSQAFIFNQKRYGDYSDLFAKQENIRIGYIDIAQFFVTKESIDTILFEENLYQSDCDFILRVLLKLYSYNKENITFLNEYLCHYNYLRQ